VCGNCLIQFKSFGIVSFVGIEIIDKKALLIVEADPFSQLIEIPDE
jgi:hypothetical protein